MDSGGGFLIDDEGEKQTVQPDTEAIRLQRERDRREQREIEWLTDVSINITRKFRKRLEPSGYQTLAELWHDLKPAINHSLSLSMAQAVQRLLAFTGDFHDYCEAYRDNTDREEYQEFFGKMDGAWIIMFQREGMSNTDKVRILNVLKDGRERAEEVLHLTGVYDGALQAAFADDDEHGM